MFSQLSQNTSSFNELLLSTTAKLKGCSCSSLQIIFFPFCHLYEKLNCFVLQQLSNLSSVMVATVRPDVDWVKRGHSALPLSPPFTQSVSSYTVATMKLYQHAWFSILLSSAIYVIWSFVLFVQLYMSALLTWCMAL